MNRPLLVAALCLHLAAVSVGLPGFAQDSAPRAVSIEPKAAQANLQTVRQYYAAMIEGVSPNIAGLTLMMTLMPKGGDLHHHYSGSIYAETFLDWVGEKGFCIWKQDTLQRLGAFKFTIESKPEELAEDVKPNCLKVEDILASSNNAFYHELLLTWSDKDFYNHSHQQSPPDQHFFDTFFYIGSISAAYPDKGLQLLKARAIAENVQYIETMLSRPPVTRNDALAAPIDALTSVSGDADVQAALAPFYYYLSADPDTRQAIDKFLEARTRVGGFREDGERGARKVIGFADCVPRCARQLEFAVWPSTSRSETPALPGIGGVRAMAEKIQVTGVFAGT
jgi:adenosine deaminase/adenosine deaminase CECR1